MRAKQPTAQPTQWSLAQTILPSAANDRGRKSRGAEAPEAGAPPAAVVAPPAPAATPAPPAPPAPSAPPPAQTAVPVWTPPPSAPAPDWGMSTSRFGNAPAVFGSAPANPQFASAPVTDYPTNYPAAPGFPPQPHYADTPGAGYLAPVTAGQWVPQHAGSQFGVTQPAPPSYGPPPFGAPGYGGYPPPQAPGSNKTRTGVIIGVCVVLVIGVLFAIAKPVYDAQHKPVPVTLVLPPTLEGSPQLHTAALQQLESTAESTVFPAGTIFTEPQAAVYGNAGAPSFIVMAAKITTRPTAADAGHYWTGVARGVSEDQITLTTVPPGALGGTTKCGLANGDTPFEVCFSLDNSAAVYVIVYTSDLVQGTLMAQKLREDVEHH